MYLRLSPYREVLQGVLISLQINEGIIKITGKSGAGKSAPCSQLYHELQANGQPAVFFLKPPKSAVALQNDILDNLSLDPTGNFTRTLTNFLLARSSEQKPLVLIFDDAQHLDPQTFSAIRMLCNIQDQSRGLVRVVLCGSDELDENLAGPALRAVTQFVNKSFTLSFLTKEQVRDFCQAFWLQTNEDMKPLGERTLDRLFDETKGHPGILQARLNQGSTGADPTERQKGGESPAPTRAYRYAGRKKSWVPAVLTVLGLAALGAGGLYLHLAPQMSAMPAPGIVADPAPTETPGPQPAASPDVPAATPTATQTTVDSPRQSIAATDVAALETAAEGPDTTTLAPSVEVIEEEAGSIDVDAEDATTVPQPEPAPATETVATVDSPAPQTPTALVETPAPREPLAQEPEEQSVEEFIAAWTASWQSQDVDAYLAHYDAGFSPTQGTREEWQEQRRRVTENARDIVIDAEAPESSVEGQDGTQVVRFWLNYSAANYADRTLKELVLTRVDGIWRIRAESSLRTERL